MSETSTVVEERERAEHDAAVDEDEVRFIPPPALIAAHSAAWAAYDAAKAAGLSDEVLAHFDEGIDLVLDAIDLLNIEAMREAGEFDLDNCRPAAEVFAEIDRERALAAQSGNGKHHGS